MENNDTPNIGKISARAIIVFQAYVDFNAKALGNIIQNAVAENEDDINPNSRVALGMAIASIGEHAEENYVQFCREYPHENIMINSHLPHFNQLNSPMVKDTVEDTLSEIVNVIQVTACAFCDKLENKQDNEDVNIAELRGLLTVLSTVRAASFVCAQSIVCVECKDEATQQSNQDALKKQITAYLH